MFWPCHYPQALGISIKQNHGSLFSRLVTCIMRVLWWGWYPQLCMRNESQESQYLRKFKFCLASKSNWDVATELCSDQFRQIYNTDKLVWIYYFHSKSTSTSSCISNISNIYIYLISVSIYTLYICLQGGERK